MRPDVLGDVTYTLRSLGRTPVWTTALILTIAVGIGSGAAVQGFVRGLLTTELPIYAIERVVTVFAVDGGGPAGPVPFEMFTALEARTDVFESLAAIRESQQRGSFDTRTSLISIAFYTPDARTLFPIVTSPGVMLGPRIRFSTFPASVDPAGKVVHIDGVPMAIAGTMPYWLEGLYRGRSVDVWAPLDAGDAEPRPVWLIGRLQPGVSRAQAQAAIDELSAPGNAPAMVLPYTGQTPEAAQGMLRVGALLEMASLLVFVIACANVAAFVVARSWARSRETAVRVAIGARRRQLLRQLLIDSAVIAVAGGAAGMVLATWAADVIPLLFFDQDAERLVFAPDARGIVTTASLCILITLACGLVPLFDTRDDKPSDVLQREGAGPSPIMTRVSTGLILLQMTACALLVIATGMLTQGFRDALHTEAGRRRGNPMLITLEALPSPSPDDGRRYFAAALNAAASVTTFTDPTWAARLPGLRPAWQWMRFDPARPAQREVTMPFAPLSAQVLAGIKLPPISGRLFGTYDANCAAIVLNEPAAKMLFSGHPIGRVIGGSDGRLLEVIGVARPADPSADAPAIYGHPISNDPLTIDGPATWYAPPSEELESGVLDVNIVSANYFDTMGLTLTAGSLFGGRPDACRTGVVNEEAATRYFNGDAVGGAVIDANGTRTEIIGVVRSAALRSSQRLTEPSLFLPVSQDYLPRMTVLASTPAVDQRTLEQVRSRIARIEGGRADRMLVTTLDDHLSNTALAPERIAFTLVGTFCVLGVALGALGLYGQMADAARRRHREFAMRLALGAQGWRVVQQVLAQGLRLAMIGSIAGAAGSIAVSRWLQTIVPAGAWPPPAVWAAAPVVLALAAVIACVIPARRALSADLLSLMRDM